MSLRLVFHNLLWKFCAFDQLYKHKNKASSKLQEEIVVIFRQLLSFDYIIAHDLICIFVKPSCDKILHNIFC